MATSRHVTRRRRTARRRTRVPSATDWIAPWMQMCEIACTAPLVIGYRTARTLTGGWPPSARDRREYTRMWQVKVEAFTQAAVAAATSAPRCVVGCAATPGGCPAGERAARTAGGTVEHASETRLRRRGDCTSLNGLATDLDTEHGGTDANKRDGARQLGRLNVEDLQL
jgi:hypothetical protein